MHLFRLSKWSIKVIWPNKGDLEALLLYLAFQLQQMMCMTSCRDQATDVSHQSDVWTMLWLRKCQKSSEKIWNTKEHMPVVFQWNICVSYLRLISSGGRTSCQEEPSLVRAEKTCPLSRHTASSVPSVPVHSTRKTMLVSKLHNSSSGACWREIQRQKETETKCWVFKHKENSSMFVAEIPAVWKLIK